MNVLKNQKDSTLIWGNHAAVLIYIEDNVCYVRKGITYHKSLAILDRLGRLKFIRIPQDAVVLQIDESEQARRFARIRKLLDERRDTWHVRVLNKLSAVFR